MGKQKGFDAFVKSILLPEKQKKSKKQKLEEASAQDVSN